MKRSESYKKAEECIKECKEKLHEALLKTMEAGDNAGFISDEDMHQLEKPENLIREAYILLTAKEMQYKSMAKCHKMLEEKMDKE